ncbi:patatin-like phospholipase family protein [Beijerinckia indica]|uniref:Patatin n=1 Tax=Beijerinckia indica subsp. indica (strain ATCC 9039 / DSM 1715 / NCIMB 8712) TaxID=395963 RepID=B2IJ81_BEII9|nr:patatin-like phospholipase family protein [Beijerinckia indica]ACB94844.1 Patatin [Beijerinckia indica subsp. indica ATCC 9039]
MATSGTKTINLALQGGGSHGAFTWGVLDRLLEVEDLVIEGISGTSAGAMNAAVLAQGYTKNGRTGAREALDRFWQRTAEFSLFSPIRRSVFDQMLGQWNIDRSVGTWWADLLQHLASPYQSNPFGFDPLKTVLSDLIIEKDIQSCESIKLFIAATNVETGRARVFLRHEITTDVLLASACLPFTFQAVEIEGVPYWDGGYMGNPVIWPLIYRCESPDVAVVQINPLERKGTPTTPIGIINRVNEISFNASLIAEMRAIAFVQRLIDEGGLETPEAKRLKRMNMHMIGCEEKLRELGAASKMNAELGFLLYLKDLGRTTADAWLQEHWDAIGQRSSLDIRKVFLGARVQPQVQLQSQAQAQTQAQPPTIEPLPSKG